MPAYVKCVRMMGGLNDKEINYTYVKVYLSFFLTFHCFNTIHVCVLGVIVYFLVNGIDWKE